MKQLFLQMKWVQTILQWWMNKNGVRQFIILMDRKHCLRRFLLKRKQG